MTLKMGFVKWYDPSAGLGVISPQDGGDDLYVSRTGIASSCNKLLREGQRVEFSTPRGRRCQIAEDVIAY